MFWQNTKFKLSSKNSSSEVSEISKWIDEQVLPNMRNRANEEIKSSNQNCIIYDENLQEVQRFPANQFIEEEQKEYSNSNVPEIPHFSCKIDFNKTRPSKYSEDNYDSSKRKEPFIEKGLSLSHEKGIITNSFNLRLPIRKDFFTTSHIQIIERNKEIKK